VEVAATQAGDPAAFARTQAGALDGRAAITEGYLRNNAGSYAEAAAFFASLAEAGGRDADTVESFLNAGLQQSNLGNDGAAERAFQAAAERGAGGDPLLGRMLRNYRAMARLNARDPAGAIAMLDQPVAPLAVIGDDALAQGVISPALADRINAANSGARRIGAADPGLRPDERARILDAQALLVRGTALRLGGRHDAALAALDEAGRMLAAVRDGKVASAGFLRAEILAEKALIAEARGDAALADRDLSDALRLTVIAYPGSAAALMAKARLAAYRARHGDAAGAMTLYSEVVADAPSAPGGTTVLRRQIEPYFALLAARAKDDPAAVAQMFAAAQILMRPGLAQTQAVLARELSAGDDEAARLFREATNSARDVARATGEVARLADLKPAEGSADAALLASARQQLADMQQQQVAIQARLGDYPRYRILDPQGITLDTLQKTLRAGEAYYELRVVGAAAYAIVVTPDAARGFRLNASAAQLSADVAALRATIVRVDGGKSVTTPFDLALARKLYLTLFGPVDDLVRPARHLIYEADGALLQLPPNLLVADQKSVEGYQARQRGPRADPFDFTHVAWLGRGRDITTAVSPRAFVDVRAAPPSHATRTYLGLGHNALPDPMTSFLSARPATVDPCAWPMDAWRNPIAADELHAARDLLGAAQSSLITGPDFTDNAIAARKDLADYRVLHFATHGLVTAPRPQCPARPALMTSWGGGGSDGLLSFREIYDLRVDADLVILSACDTAGMATIDATREAGVETGGNFALDGLVRAFVGAGARTVVASHWPVPDDYSATKRLILGMVGARSGVPVAAALRGAETALMDDPATSHPFYWAAFAIVGDGSRPILGQR
jgi:CHAT domain-containing protein